MFEHRKHLEIVSVGFVFSDKVLRDVARLFKLFQLHVRPGRLNQRIGIALGRMRYIAVIGQGGGKFVLVIVNIADDDGGLRLKRPGKGILADVIEDEKRLFAFLGLHMA